MSADKPDYYRPDFSTPQGVSQRIQKAVDHSLRNWPDVTVIGAYVFIFTEQGEFRIRFGEGRAQDKWGDAGKIAGDSQ